MLCAAIEPMPEESIDRVHVLLWDNADYDRLQPDPRIHVLHYPDFTWDLELLADRFEALVWDGGAIIDDQQFAGDPGNYNTGNLFVRLSELMLGRGKKAYALGLSTNDNLADTEFNARLVGIVDRCELFSVRDDPFSVQALARAGVDKSKIIQCEDLAFCRDELRRLRETHVAAPEKRLGVVLLCIESRSERNRALLEPLVSSTRLKDEGYSISLIPFLDEGGWDSAYFRRLLERFLLPEWVPWSGMRKGLQTRPSRGARLWCRASTMRR